MPTEAEPGGYLRQIGGDRGGGAEVGCDPAPGESCDSGAAGLNANTTTDGVTSSCFSLHFQKLMASSSLILLTLGSCVVIPHQFDLSTDTCLQLLVTVNLLPVRLGKQDFSFKQTHNWDETKI